MKRLLILLALLFAPTFANAQQILKLCFVNANGGCTTVSTANPFPVTSSGGGGGAITIASGAVASGAYSSGSIASGAYAAGSIGSGAMVDLGAKADAVCGTATGTCSLIALVKFLNTGVGSAIPTGTNNIGAVNTAFNVTPNNCSGTITAGGTAQNAFASSAVRHGFILQDIPDAVADEAMWISFTGTSAANIEGSYSLNPGTFASSIAGGSVFIPVGFNTALSIVSATTGKKFSCTWW